MGPSSRFRLCSCMCVYTWYENRGQRSSLVSFFKHCLHFPWFLLLAWGGGPQRDKADCQSIPQILLSSPPKYWNYYQVTMYRVVGSWGLSSGPDSCQASTLMAEISPHSQVQMILLNYKFKNDSLVCFLFFSFLFLYQGLHFEEMMVMHPVKIFPSMPCSKGDQWCSCGSNWEGPPGEQVWKSLVQLGELVQKKRQHHSRPFTYLHSPSTAGGWVTSANLSKSPYEKLRKEEERIRSP